MKLLSITILIVLFGLLALPVLAQDTTPEPAPTLDVTVAPTAEPTPAPVEPPVIDTSELPGYALVLAGLIVLGVLILFGAVLYVVYNSIPAWAQDGITAAIIRGVQIGKDAAAATPTQIDDAIVDEIARRVSAIINVPLAAKTEE